MMYFTVMRKPMMWIIRYIADQTGNGIIPMCIHKSNVTVIFN